MKIFSIYDTKSEVFSQPFYTITSGSAIRSFTEIANDKEHQIGKHPEDFVLYEIGTWHEAVGTIVPLEHNVNLGKAKDYINKSN